MIAYLVTNIKTDRPVYVGITSKSLKTRWERHLRDAKYICRAPLHMAFRKYGIDSFAVEAVLCAGSWKDLCAAERQLIAQHGTFAADGGYNLTKGGEGTLGTKQTPDRIALTIASNRSRKYSPETRAKMASAMLGRKLGPISAEQKKKISIANSGKTRSDAARAKVSAARTGRALSPEHVAKVKAALAQPECVAKKAASFAW